MSDDVIGRLDRRRRLDHALAKRVIPYLPPIALLALAIATWQAVAVAKGIPDYLLPTPSQIWQTTVDERQLLWENTVPTFEIATLGFLMALGLGVALAIAIHYSRLLEITVYPLVIASQTVPVVALAPILVILLGFTILPKLIIVCLICFFPITVNLVDGFKSVDPDLINVMRTLGAGRWRMFRDVEWPGALPHLFSGARVAVTYCVIGAIFGEWVGSSEGLGYLLTQSREQFDTARIFSAMLILTVMGIGLFLVVTGLERLILPWYHDDRRRTALTRRP